MHPFAYFKDERTTHLPSLEIFLVCLYVDSCNDSWHFINSIILTNYHFLNWKAQLLERKTPKTRLLNVEITEEVVN